MRQTHIASGFLVFFLSLCSLVLAEPSGGPYGPISQSYALPDAKTIRYVAPDGDPSSNGMSLDQPTSLEHAISESKTDDAVILRGGLYRTGSIRFNQGILIQPYLGEKPILKGTLVPKGNSWHQINDSLWSVAWEHLFPAEPADWWWAPRHLETTPMHRFNYDMVFADGKRLESAGSMDEVSDNAYYIDYQKGTVVIGINPSNHLIEITAHDSAMVRTMRSINGLENDHKGPTIRGIKFTQYARLALLIEGLEPWKPMQPSEYGKDVVGTTLENLTLSFCSRVAGYFRGDNLTIRHCLVADCGTEGIYVINSSNVLLERNKVTRTNSHTPIQGYYASAVKIFNQSHHVICRDNLIINNPHTSGIWYDVGNRHMVVVDNWIENTNDGAFFEISEGAICAGNLFVNCSPGVKILNSANVSVYQNTFYNSALEATRTMRSSEAGDHFGWHASSGPAVADRDRHEACNNLFLVDEQESKGMLHIFEQPEVGDIAKQKQFQRLDGNTYVKSPLSAHSPLLVTGSPSYPPSDRELILSESLEGVRKLDSKYEINGQMWINEMDEVVRSAELKRFELLPSFPGRNGAVSLPQAVSKQIDQQYREASFPGAWPPMD